MALVVDFSLCSKTDDSVQVSENPSSLHSSWPQLLFTAPDFGDLIPLLLIVPAEHLGLSLVSHAAHWKLLPAGSQGGSRVYLPHPVGFSLVICATWLKAESSFFSNFVN